MWSTKDKTIIGVYDDTVCVKVELCQVCVSHISRVRYHSSGADGEESQTYILSPRIYVAKIMGVH